MSQAVAVIGLGNIGGPIATRVWQMGHRVIGVDSNVNTRSGWARLTGQQAVATVEDLTFLHCGRALVVVNTTNQALGVVRDLAEHVTGTNPLPVHLMTTLDPIVARSLADHQQEGISLLEQPVSGGATGAAAGDLTVLTAGPSTPDDLTFLRETVAATVVSLTCYGQPTLIKLLNNALAGVNCRAMAQVLMLAEQWGLDVPQVKAVIDNSSGASAMGAMLGDLADEQAALLAKDIRLLGAILQPPMSVDLAHDVLIDEVARARSLLIRDPELEAKDGT